MKTKGIARLLSLVMAVTCVSFPAVSHAADGDLTPAEKVNFGIDSFWWNGDWICAQSFYKGFSVSGSNPEYSDGGASYGIGSDGTQYATFKMNDNTLTEDQLQTKDGGTVLMNPSWPGDFTMTEPTAPNPADTEKYPNGEADENYIADKAAYDTEKAAYDAAKAEYDEKLAAHNNGKTMIEPASGWGYTGVFIAAYNGNVNSDAYYGHEPSEYYGGVVNLNSVKDNAYAVYKIKVTDGDLGGTYLGLGYYGDSWYCDKYTNSAGNAYTEFDPADETTRGASIWQMAVAGVNLADYYNESNQIDADGFHTIIVPLSVFEKSNADFRKKYSKTSPVGIYEDTSELNYGMVKSLGIVRTDSKSEKTFEYQTKGFAIVAPQAPANFTAEKDEMGVQLTWDPVNSGVTYQVKKTVNGQTEYIDVDAADYAYYDTIDTSSDYITYSVIAADSQYGVTAETDKAEFNKPVETTALKDTYYNNGVWGDYINAFTYAVGAGNEWFDYDSGSANNSTFANHVWSASLDDNTLTQDQLVVRPEGYKGAGIIANPTADASISAGMIEPNTGWGYRGFKVFYNHTGSDSVQTSPNNKYLAGVTDLRDYMDNGNIVYKFNADGQNLDGVYFTVGYYKDFWDLGWYWGGDAATNFSYYSTYIDAQKLDENADLGGVENWRHGTGEYRRISFAGVPVKDYYDEVKGGEQTVVIPLSDFATKSQFNKLASKTINNGGADWLSSEDHGNTFNPALVSTVGIARMDSKSGRTFTSKISDVALVAPTAVTNLKGTYNKTTGEVSLTWLPSTDTDVAKYRVKKDVMGNVEYIDLDASATSYADTLDPASKKQVKYSVVTVDSIYGAEGETSDKFIVNERTETTALVKKMTNNNNFFWDSGLGTYSVNVGGSSEWGEYPAGSIGTSGTLEFQLNDNTLTEDQLKAHGGYYYGGTKKVNPPTGAEHMLEYSTKWGFSGMKLGYSAGNYEGPCGTVDLRGYEDGYAVFKIDVTGQNLDGVYASIGYHDTLYDFNGCYSETNVDSNGNLLHTNRNLDDVAALETYYLDGAWKKMGYDLIRIAGVPLADYVDPNAEGIQTVKIPLKDFETAAFKRLGSKKSPDASVDTTEFNYAMVTALGIAREDLDDTTTTNFSYEFTDMAFVCPKPVEEVTAKAVAGGVKVSWMPSTDTDVTQQLVKVKDRQATYIDVVGNEYTAADVAAEDEVMYYVVTTDTTYGTTAQSNVAYYNTPEIQPELVDDFEVGAQSQNGAEAEKYDHTTVMWYTGVLNASDEYDDWYGAQINGLAPNKYVTYWLADSTYTYPDGTVGANKGKVTADKEYGIGGYEFSENKTTLKDISAYPGGYVLMDVSFNDIAGGALDLSDTYFTVEFAKDWWDVADSVGNPTYGAARVYRSIIAGVPVADYYNASAGGTQRVAIPLSAFTNANNPAMKYVKTRENHFADLLKALQTNDYDFADHMDKFKGVAVARKDKKNASGITYNINDIYIVNTAAPRALTAEVTEGGVVLNWKDAAVDNVSEYVVYRNGRLLTKVNGTSYTDTGATGGDYAYEVKTVSPTYANVYSAAASVNVNVPIATYIKFLDSNSTETKYLTAGTMSVEVKSSVTGSMGYAALFDEHGVLKAVKSAPLGKDTAETLPFTNVAATDTLKGFIWDAKMVPVCDPASASEKPTKVLVIGDEISAQAADYVDEIAANAGDNVEVTNLYTSVATMNDQYTNITADNAVYTMTVNGAAVGENVSAIDVLSGDEWDYILLQDRAVYEEMIAYYDADSGSAALEVSALVDAIKANAKNATVYTLEATGFNEAFYNNASESLRTYIADEVGAADYSSTTYTSQLPASVIAKYTSAMTGETAYIATHDVMSAYGNGDGATLLDETGIGLTADGKFFASGLIYKAITGNTVNAAYAPSGVSDAAGIVALIN